MTARLVTIPVSHYCEKARWALDRSGMPYVEDGWPPALHRLALARHRATTAPVLVLPDGRVLRESAEIVRHAGVPGGPEDDVLVARFDRRLGPAARLLAYANVLDHPEAFVAVATAGVSPRRARALRASRRAVGATIRRFFGIDADAVRRAEATVEEELASVAGHGPYLTGDRFGAADLTFAALGAPLVWPERYGAPVPPLQALPAGAREAVARWRATPGGERILRLYADHRAPAPALSEAAVA